MTKIKKITLELDFQSALELLQVIDSSIANYSKDFAPERIVRLREVLSQLDYKMEKSIL